MYQAYCQTLIKKEINNEKARTPRFSSVFVPGSCTHHKDGRCSISVLQSLRLGPVVHDNVSLAFGVRIYLFIILMPNANLEFYLQVFSLVASALLA